MAILALFPCLLVEKTLPKETLSTLRAYPMAYLGEKYHKNVAPTIRLLICRGYKKKVFRVLCFVLIP